MVNKTKDTLRGLAARIGEIRYALKGVALEWDEGRGLIPGPLQEQERESLSLAVSLLDEAVSSIAAAVGE